MGKNCKRCKSEFTYRYNHTLYCELCRPIADKTKVARGIRRYNQKRRLEALRAYSNGVPKCACCGEKIVEFLTIDHIANNGYALRKAGIHGSAVYAYLKKHEYPDGFQVLCFNCNCARGQQADKICPHHKLADKGSGNGLDTLRELAKQPLPKPLMQAIGI